MLAIFTRGLQITYILSIAVVMVSCNNSHPIYNTTDTAEEKNNAKFNTNNALDAQFVVSAINIYLNQVHFAQLAQKVSTSNAVKDMAKAIEDVHTRSLANLKSIATSKAIVIPTTQTDSAEDNYTHLKAQSGKDFDQEYCALVVNSHRDAITLFEAESTTAIDADIRQWAKASLPDLNNHLKMALACQAKWNK